MRCAPALLFLIAVPAVADEPAPVPLPASVTETTVPPVPCTQPDLPDLSKVTAAQVRSLEERIKAYGECMRQYIDERHAKSSQYIALQKAEVDASNAAAKAINEFFARVRDLEAQQRAAQAAKKAH